MLEAFPQRFAAAWLRSLKFDVQGGIYTKAALMLMLF
jgi:hypothetical protein